MLMQIRERATGVFAYIIVILIAIPFAFWGIQEYFGGPADQKVAEVNGEEIIKRIFDSQLQDQRRYLKSLLGNSFDSIYSDEDKLKESVLDTIIQNALLSEETKSAGYRISNTKLSERIQAVPQFQKNGKFDANTYEQLLAAQRRSPPEFEDQLRQEESINQYQGSVVYSSFLPLNDKRRFASLKQQKRNFDYFLIEPDRNSVEVSADEVSTYYESHKESFKTSERVKLEYLEILQKEIGDSLSYSEEELFDSYNDDPSRYQSAELRKASHILLRLSEDAFAEDVELALSRAQAVVDRIRGGEIFASLAEEVSEDGVSAKNGGNLGYLTRSDIDNPAFVEKLFSMNSGEMSSPIRTKLGVQLVQLDDITPSKTKPFEDVRDQIENELRAEVAEHEFVELAEQLSNISYVNEDNLNTAAEALNMKTKSTDWVTGPTLEGIASYPSVIAAAFSDEVLNKGLNSTLLEVADGHVVVVRVVEHENAEIQPLEQIAEAIKQSLGLSKALEQAQGKGSNAIAMLQKDSNQIDVISKGLGVSVQSPGALLRDDDSVPREIANYVFTLSSIENEYPVFDGVQLDSGQYAVVRLNEVVTITEAEADIETAEWISVQGRYGRREMSAMLKALRETGDVTVFPENL